MGINEFSKKGNQENNAIHNNCKMYLGVTSLRRETCLQ
jgi:hypothetical protein